MTMKRKIKIFTIYAAPMLFFIPCLAAFSEGDDIRVNIFGYAYTALLFCVIKFSSKIEKFLKKWRNSTTNLFPEIKKYENQD